MRQRRPLALADLLRHEAHHRRPSRQGLQAAPPATRAAWSLRAQHHVTDLAGSPARAADELAILDESAADTGSNKNGDH